MEEFLNELMETFPEEKQIKVQHTSFLTLKKSNSKKVVEVFMSAIQPYAEKITNKDEEFILTSDIEFLNKLNIKKWWTKDLSSNTKDAIWQYLNTLYMLGCTITSIPPELLKSIEGIAEECTSNMSSSNEAPNMGNLFSSVSNMLGGQLGNMLGNTDKK